MGRQSGNPQGEPRVPFLNRLCHVGMKSIPHMKDGCCKEVAAAMKLQRKWLSTGAYPDTKKSNARCEDWICKSSQICRKGKRET